MIWKQVYFQIKCTLKQLCHQWCRWIKAYHLVSIRVKDAIWKSDFELKIDKNGYVILDGIKSKNFWDAKIFSKVKPLRMKIRNIAGDESVIIM